MAFADTEHEAASFADAGSQATPQDFGDDGSLGSVPRGGFISATPIGRGKREVRIPTDGASVTSFDTALSPDRQTSLVSGLETLSLEAPSVTFVGTKRRHVAGAMTNTHAVRMPRGAASPARSLGASDGLGPELSIDRFSHTGSDILSQEEGLGNLHNPSYSETGDLFVGNRWSGQGHDGGAWTLVGGGGSHDGRAGPDGRLTRRRAAGPPFRRAAPAHPPWRARPPPRARDARLRARILVRSTA